MAPKSGSKTGKILIWLLVIIAAGFMYWYFFLRSNLEETRQLIVERIQLTREINNLEQKVERAPQKEAEWEEEWEPLQKDYYTLFPEINDLPRVLHQFQLLIESFDLTVSSLRVSEFAAEANNYRLLPVSFSVEGTYENLLRLLEDIEQFPHKTIVEQLDLGSNTFELHFSIVFRQEGEVGL